jgi:hypothetical protein
MGPVSFAYCDECAARPAEPEWVFRMTYDDCGENVAEWVNNMMTWKDGAYVRWPDWVAAKKESA